MFDTSFIEISRSALKKNLEFIRNQIDNNIKLSSVVKGNAYGHGIKKFIPLAEEFGIDHFSVFSSKEALETFESKVNSNTKIMIMGMIPNGKIEWAIKNDIEFYVFELDRLKTTNEIATKLNKKALVHINVETGMNRIGFEKHEMEKVVNYLRSDYIQFQGLCTHFAGAESIANYYRVTNQIKIFKRIIHQFQKKNLNPKRIHCASSAATMNYPNTRFNMVRIGILQYGLWPSKETLIHYLGKHNKRKNPIQRIINWKSCVMNTKNISSGNFIGYNNTFQAQEDMKIAVIPVGYTNGYSRSLSNHGSVIINGNKVKVIGTVNMNMLIVNISEIPYTKKGNEVLLIGNQNGQEITVSAFGEYTNQMNYESLARLPADIPRKIIE